MGSGSSTLVLCKSSKCSNSWALFAASEMVSDGGSLGLVALSLAVSTVRRVSGLVVVGKQRQTLLL